MGDTVAVVQFDWSVRLHRCTGMTYHTHTYCSESPKGRKECKREEKWRMAMVLLWFFFLKGCRLRLPSSCVYHASFHLLGCIRIIQCTEKLPSGIFRLDCLSFQPRHRGCDGWSEVKILHP